MPGDNDGWMDADRYVQIHQSCMDQVEKYFVLDHDLHRPSFVSISQIRFQGIIHCNDGIEIHVDEVLLRDRRNRVRGYVYRYHALIRMESRIDPAMSHVVNILRYDNADHFANHADAFHKHTFTADGDPDAVQHIGRQNFPTLRNVIDEVFEWWKDHQGKPPLIR